MITNVQILVHVKFKKIINQHEQSQIFENVHNTLYVMCLLKTNFLKMLN